TVNGSAKGTACKRSSASATDRAVFLSTSTISRPMPRMTSAYAAVEPTNPQPTMPIFMVHLPFELARSGSFDPSVANDTEVARERPVRKGNSRAEIAEDAEKTDSRSKEIHRILSLFFVFLCDLCVRLLFSVTSAVCGR